MSRAITVAVAFLLLVGGGGTALAHHRPGHPAKPAKAERGGSAKVMVCHGTGNGRSHTIRVSERALPAHVRHGDSVGPCAAQVPAGFTRLGAELTATAGATGEGRAIVSVRVFRRVAVLCFRLRVSGVEATGAHIHIAAAATIGRRSFDAGDIVIRLRTPNANGVSRGCTLVSRALARALVASPAAFYVDVHSQAFPGGQVRGALAQG